MLILTHWQKFSSGTNLLDYPICRRNIRVIFLCQEKNFSLSGSELVGIAAEEQVNREFIDAWRRAERGEINVPEERLYFLESKTFFSLLSPRRLKLLHALRPRGVISIQALSKVLRRKYQNVDQDVQLLKKAGLIRQKDTQYVFVPWDTIRTEINLAEPQLSSAG